MTIVAWRIRCDMVGRFAGCGNTVMATGTGSGDHRVVEPDLLPIGRGGMTYLAGGRGGYMRRVLASGRNTVMA